jgi:DnaJ-class molecular chaperone
MVLVKERCPFCQGSGVRIVETSSLFGLMKRQVPTTCDQCNGTGFRVTLPVCEFCEGQGLVGNERDICRACNGTGRIDAFGFIPRAMLKPSLLFERRCDQCGERTFEIISEIEQKKLSRTWEREEELRQVEIVEQVKVRCSSCGQTYYVAVNPGWHQDLVDDEIRDLENIGINLSFMYQRG